MLIKLSNIATDALRKQRRIEKSTFFFSAFVAIETHSKERDFSKA